MRKNDARIDFVLKDRSIAIDELESRAVGRFEEIEKRLQALEGKAPEATSAQEREDTDYKLYGVICKKPGLGVYELAKELGWSSDKVYGSIRHLVRDGVDHGRARWPVGAENNAGQMARVPDTRRDRRVQKR